MSDDTKDVKTEKPAAFKARKIIRSYIQKINASPAEIFPLLCPRRELDWLDGWNFQMIFSDSGYAEEGCVFKTKHEESVDTIWVVSRYEPENSIIEFVRVTPGIVVVKINIFIKDNFNATSDLHIEYQFTALTEKGNEFLEDNSSKQFLDMMKWWEKSMNYYLESGNKLLALQLKPKKSNKTENKSADNKTADNKKADNKKADNKNADSGPAENPVAENPAAENPAEEQNAAEAAAKDAGTEDSNKGDSNKGDSRTEDSRSAETSSENKTDETH